MKVSFLEKIQGRTKVLSIVGLASLVIVSAAIQNNSIRSQKLMGLKNGVQTCFTRLHNTYTARLLGGASDYLSKQFTATTEECLGEAVQVYEQIGLTNNVILDDLNALANDSNWFHQQVLTEGKDGLFEGSPESVLLNSISGKFEKLELKKIQVNEGLATLENVLNGRKETMSLFFYVIAAFVPLFLGLDYLRRRSEEDALEEVKKESDALVASGETRLSDIRPLVVRALKTFGLGQLAEQFELALLRSEDIGVRRNDTAGLQVPVVPGKVNRTEQIDEMWTRPDQSSANGKSAAELMPLKEKAPVKKSVNKPAKKKVDNRPTVDLEECIASVVELISSKVFTQGVNLDVDSEDIKIYGDHEAVQQAIYHVFANALENYNFDDPTKELTLTTKVLGSTVFVDIYDSGREFSKEFLRQSLGLATGLIQHTDLAIAQELIQDMDAKVSFENVSNKAGEHVGRKVRLVLEAAPAKGKSVSRIEKGSKKDILARMQAN